MNEKPLCLITGGHLTPGLAVAQSLTKNGWEVNWVGVKKAFSKGQAKSLEAIVLPSTNIRFYSISTFKWDRNNPFLSFFSIWKIIGGLSTSFKIIKTSRPKVIFSLGGFVSFPVCLAGWLLGVPIVIHEQTSSAGLANRIIAELSDIVAISFVETYSDFPFLKTFYTGNPVREEIFKLAKIKKFDSDKKEMTLYITGGSRGSSVINRVIYESLPEILKKYTVIHQTGEDFVLSRKTLEAYGKVYPGKYRCLGTFSLKEVEEIYKKADIIISRSGANTVSEVAILGMPAIFIPLPNTQGNEQSKNAQLLEKNGLALIIPQENFSKETLLTSLKKIVDNYAHFRKKGREVKSLVPQDAVLRIVRLLDSVIS